MSQKHQIAHMFLFIKKKNHFTNIQDVRDHHPDKPARIMASEL